MVQIEWLALEAWVDRLLVEGARPMTDRRVIHDLQDLCRLQVARGVALTNTEQQRLGRRLALLSARCVDIPVDAGRWPEPTVGARMPLSATAMACGSMVWTDQPAAIVGVVTRQEDGQLALRPLALGGATRGRASGSTAAARIGRA
jgi:hypothetical protein